MSLARIRRALLVVLCGTLSLFAGGCSRTLVRVPAPSLSERAAGPPRLDSALDLGALPLPAQGELSTEHTDRLFTPGEWVALGGENLVGSSRITLGGRPVAVAGRLANGALLVRVPRGVPAGLVTLTIDNGLGIASLQLRTALYAFGGDVHDGALRVRRIIGQENQGAQGLAFEDKDLDIPFAKARFQALSADGGILYALQEEDTHVTGAPSVVSGAVGLVTAMAGGEASCELLVVHLGGKSGPQKLRTTGLTLSSQPTGLAVSPAGLLVILQQRQLTVLDISDPMQPRRVAQLAVAETGPERELIDAEFLAGGKLLAVLEAYANQVHLVDLAVAGQPRVLSAVGLSRALDQPFSIDLAASADGQSLWILQGPNLKLGGKRLLDGLGAAWSDVRSLEFRAAAKHVGGAMGGAAMLPPDKGAESPSRLVQLTLTGGGLQLARSVALPGSLFPFFILPDRAGSVFVSGISRTNPFADVEGSADGLLRLLTALKNTVQLGTVLKVGTEDGALTTVLQGVAIYYDLALLPNGQPLVSTVRLGPGYIPPRLTLDWGLEIAGGSFSKLREVANTGFKITQVVKRLLPPYRYERIGVQ